MNKSINCTNEEEQIHQVYDALQKWAGRIQRWHYETHPNRRAKHNKKGKLISPFYPDEDGLILTQASGNMLKREITPEEAMAVLNTPNMRYKKEVVMDAGF